MSSALKNTVKTALYKAGYYRLYRRLKASPDKRLLILMYHDLVSEGIPDHGPSIADEDPTASQFEAHLKTIRNDWRVVSLKDAIQEIRSRGELYEDSVAVTFDDGHASVYTLAYPLLKRFKIPATVFLTTEWINGNLRPWWYDLRDMITQSNLRGITNTQLDEAVRLDSDAPHSPVGTDIISRRRMFDRLESFLRDSRDEDCQAAIRRLQRLLLPDGGYVPPRERPLTWDQIREMTLDDIDFETHTCNHINIRWADEETIEREIVDSKLEIENRIRRPVRGFAYPYGKDLVSYIKAEEILRRHDFLYACNAYTGNNDGSSNLYSLRRGGLPLTESAALIGRDLCLRLVRENKPVR